MEFFVLHQLGCALALLLLAVGGAGAEPGQARISCRLPALEEALTKSEPALAKGDLKEVYRDLSHALRVAEELEEQIAGLEAEARCRRPLSSLFFQLGWASYGINLDLSEDYFERGKALLEQEMGPDHPKIADFLDRLAQIQYRSRRNADAFRSLERSLELRRKGLPPKDPKIARSLLTLGTVYESRGEPVVAEQMFREAIAMLEAAGEEHRLQLAETLVSLSLLLEKLGDTEEAEALNARAMAIDADVDEPAPTVPRLFPE